MAMDLEPEQPMESESEVVEEVDEGSSEEVDSEESDYESVDESDNESDNKSEVTHVAMKTREDAVVVGDGGANPLFISESSVEKTMLRMGKKYFEAGEGIEGENEWQKMKMMECEINIRLLEVRAAQTKLVLNGLKAGNR